MKDAVSGIILAVLAFLQLAVPPAAQAARADGLTGVLVFQEHNGGMIYLYDLESKTLKALTTGYDPALSPDGSTVAFIRYGGEQGLYLIGADGTDERRIYGGSRDLRAPSWSPDGQYIAFSRVTGEEYCRQMGPRCVPDRSGLEDFPLVILDKRGLSRVNTDGGDFQDIPTMETATASDWNAAGIVYAAAEGLQITAEQPNSTTRSLLDARNYSAQDPDWQPGGGRIIFQRKEGTHWEIFSVNPDGSGLTALTRPASVLVKTLPQNVSPAWSPNGRHIVYLSNRDASNSAGAWHLWVMNADGSSQHQLDPEVLGQIEFRYDTSVDQMVAWS
jgi:Tol biopolymer transport system component